MKRLCVGDGLLFVYIYFDVKEVKAILEKGVPNVLLIYETIAVFIFFEPLGFLTYLILCSF